MKYTFTPMDAGEYLNLINSEADPTLDAHDLKFIKMGDKYMVALLSGFGLFITPQYTRPEDMKDKDFDKLVEKWVEDVETEYGKRKMDPNNHNRLLGSLI